MKKYILYFILGIIFLSYCSNVNTKNDNRDNEEIEKVNQALIKNSKIDTTNFNLYISLFKSRLPNYQDEFNDDTNCINLMPISLLSKFTQNEYDTIYDVAKAFAMSYYNLNKKFISVMYKIDCMAGEYCGRYYIATYELSGELINNEKIGIDMGTSDERTLFDYKVISENHIETYWIDRKYDEDGNIKKEKVETKQIMISEQGKISIE